MSLRFGSRGGCCCCCGGEKKEEEEEDGRGGNGDGEAGRDDALTPTTRGLSRPSRGVLPRPDRHRHLHLRHHRFTSGPGTTTSASPPRVARRAGQARRHRDPATLRRRPPVRLSRFSPRAAAACSRAALGRQPQVRLVASTATLVVRGCSERRESKRGTSFETRRNEVFPRFGGLRRRFKFKRGWCRPKATSPPTLAPSHPRTLAPSHAPKHHAPRTDSTRAAP